MAGAGDDMIFWLPRQRVAHPLFVPRVRLVVVVRRAPELDRDPDVFQSSGNKCETECRGGDDRGLDARIRCPRIGGSIAT